MKQKTRPAIPAKPIGLRKPRPNSEGDKGKTISMLTEVFIQSQIKSQNVFWLFTPKLKF